jgi:hypothetical protein
MDILHTARVWTFEYSRYKPSVPEIIKSFRHGSFHLNTKFLDFFSKKLNILCKLVICGSLHGTSGSGIQEGKNVHILFASGRKQILRRYVLKFNVFHARALYYTKH